MNSIAYAAPATASTPAAQVTSIEEGRTEHDQGYFFRIPDWLADRLGQQRASGAAWALVTLVGRKTRWGQHHPAAHHASGDVGTHPVCPADHH